MRRDIRLRPGLQADDTPNRVRQGGYTDVSNMRPWRGSMQTIGGWESAFIDQLDGKCRGMHQWTDNSGETCYAFGTNTKLYLYRGGALYDVTPTSDFTAGAENGTGGAGWGTGEWSEGEWGVESTDATFALTWSLDNWGEDLLANPRGQTIFRLVLADLLDGSTLVAEAITNAPDECGFMLVADEQRQVIAYACSEEVSGDLNPRAVRFSDAEDLTDWTTATDNLAGEYITSGSGVIQGAVELADAILVLTDSTAYLQQFTGDFTQPWRFDRIADRCGLAGPNAVTTAQNVAYWISESGIFWRYVLGGAPTRLITPVVQSLNNEMDTLQREKIFATTRNQFQEVIWFYPTPETGENAAYLSYNTQTEEWGKGDLARTAAIDAGPSDYAMAADPDGTVYWHELNNTANGGAIIWRAESGFIRLGDGDRSFTIKGSFPDIHEQQGPVMLTLTAYERPQGAVTDTAMVTLTPDQPQADFFVTGRYIKIKYSGETGPTFARLGTITMDMTARGRR
jgi:hypothetical protein